MPRVAGGRVLGAFGYTSAGDAGWSVAARVDVGGLTDDAVHEGRGLVERLPWWDKEPIQEGDDVLKRPRRLAWLGGRGTPRRFLLHTIHAEKDASTRPGNNYSECLVVSGASDAVGTSHTGADSSADASVRPSQLWDPLHWCTPWGADEVSRQRPGAGPFTHPMGQRLVLERILQDQTGLPRLRLLHRLLHATLHLDGEPVVATVDDLIWGAVLLDTCLSLMPDEDVWDATFDIRSVAPATPGGGGPSHRAMINLYDEHSPGVLPADAVDLTEAHAASSAIAAAAGPSPPCPECGTWFSSMAAVLSEPNGVSIDRIQATLNALRQAAQRLRGLPPASTSEPIGRYPAGHGRDAVLPRMEGPRSPVAQAAGEPRPPLGLPPGADAQEESLMLLSRYLDQALEDLRSLQPDAEARVRYMATVWTKVAYMSSREREALTQPVREPAQLDDQPVAATLPRPPAGTSGRESRSSRWFRGKDR